jgi:hypothetical protein
MLQPFSQDDLVYTYTAEMACSDGYLVSAREGELATVTAERFGLTRPVYLTRSLFGLIEKAVENPRWLNDWSGVWHDITWMSRGAVRGLQAGDRRDFVVIITGAGRRRNHRLTVAFDGLAFTYMLPEED